MVEVICICTMTLHCLKSASRDTSIRSFGIMLSTALIDILAIPFILHMRKIHIDGRWKMEDGRWLDVIDVIGGDGRVFTVVSEITLCI